MKYNYKKYVLLEWQQGVVLYTFSLSFLTHPLCHYALDTESKVYSSSNIKKERILARFGKNKENKHWIP